MDYLRSSANNITHSVMKDRLYDANSFGRDEILSWLKWQNETDTIRLWAPNKEDSELCRKRVLNVASRNKLIIETERMSDQVIEIRYTGNLFNYG